MTFTDHIDDIEYQETLYHSNNAIEISSVASKNNYSVDNTDLVGFLRTSGIRDEDIFAEAYDEAFVEIMMVNYNRLEDGHLVLKTGYMGEIKKGKDNFTSEVRGLTQKLEQNFIKLYSPTCRAKFCDGDCGIDINNSVNINNVSYPLKSTGVVDSITDNRLITDSSRTEPTGFFNFGYIEFTSGLNQGRKMEVRTFEGNTILLFLPLKKTIKIGDTFNIYAGCDRYFNTCINKFNNAINFRGEPHLPGRDKIYETSSNKTASK